MRILIIEDEEQLARHLKNGLAREGFVADYVCNGEDGQTYVELHHDALDLVILDLTLPLLDGLTVCKNLRRQEIMTPILILAARDTTEDKIIGLNNGADDYLTKPFSFDELLARIRALLRRPKTGFSETIRLGNLTLNVHNRSILCNDKTLLLSHKEFDLLEYFIRHPNQVLSREQILENLWDMNFDSFSNVVDVHIKNVRKKLKDIGYVYNVETVYGLGYRLKV